MLKIYTLSLVFFLAAITGLRAQQSNIMFFMHSVPQLNFVNPAIQSECRWFVGLPVLSSVHFNLANSGFTINQLLEDGNNGSFSLDADNMVRKLANRNYLSSELYTNLLVVGHKRGDYYFTFSVRERNDFILFYPKDLFAFAWRGNTQFEGERISLNGAGIQFNHFREYAVGVSKKYDDYSTFGIRGKLLFGKLNLNTRKSKIGLFTEENTFDLTFTNDIVINASLPFSLEIDDQRNFTVTDDYYTSIHDLILNRRNIGLAVDAGFIYEYDENITVSGSILDLGAIFYRTNLTNYSVEGEYFYDGPVGDTIDTENYLEDIANTFTEGSNISNNSYLFATHLKMHLGATYKLNEKINFGLLLSGKAYRQNFQSGMTVSANSRLARYLAMSLSWSYINRSMNNLGVGLAFGRSPVQFYIISDNVPGMIWPQSAKNINIRFGLGINFGCLRKEDIKGCGCYWLQQAEEKRERKERLLK